MSDAEIARILDEAPREHQADGKCVLDGIPGIDELLKELDRVLRDTADLNQQESTKGGP